MAYNHDNVIDKLLKLNERIAVDIGIGGDVTGRESDLIWCKRLIDDVKGGGLVPNKQEFTMANLMWRKYGRGVETDDVGMWEVIDTLLTHENPSKIQAIKMYRRFIRCTLKEAKEMVDAREIKIKKEW